MDTRPAARQGIDILDNAVGQLSLVTAAMRMLLENCEIALLEAAEISDPGPAHPVRSPMRQGSGRRPRQPSARLRPRRQR